MVIIIKADSSNMPKVDVVMIMEYFNSNRDFISAEMRGVKNASTYILIYFKYKKTKFI